METLALQAGGQAAGSLVTPAVECGKGIFNCLKRKYDYVKNIKENMAKLEKEESYLVAHYKDVKAELERNMLSKEKTNRCETWLGEVENVKQDIEKLMVEYEKTSTYLCGLCPFPGLLKLGKRIVMTTEEVVELRSQIAQINIMRKKPPAPPPKPVKSKRRPRNNRTSNEQAVTTCL